MCRHGIALGFWASVIVASPSASMAQEVRVHERTVDSLVARWTQARATLQEFDDSVRAVRLAYDTVLVPPLRILATPATRALGEAAARIAVQRLPTHVGPAIDRLAPHWFVVRPAPTEVPGIRVTVLDSLGREHFAIHSAPDTNDVAQALAATGLRLLAATVDPPLRSWLSSHLFLDTVPTVSWPRLRLDLVSSSTIAARECYSGDIAACSVALALTPSRDPVREWYDAAGRRNLVEQRPRLARRADAAATTLCLGGDDQSCISVIQAASLITTPAPVALRVSLAQVALQMGGAGALERLLAAPGTPAERLAAAAGAPLDAVLGQWQSRLRNARVPSGAMSAEIVAMSLVWILALAALSLRSSRWR